MLSLAGFRAPTFSLSVTRDDVGLEDEFELSMRFLGTYFSCYVARVGMHRRISRVLNIGVPLVDWMRKRGSYHQAYCTQYPIANTE